MIEKRHVRVIEAPKRYKEKTMSKFARPEEKKTATFSFAQHNYFYVKVKRPHEESVRRSANKVNILWDELEYFLHDDEDFEIESIEKNIMTIKTKRREAFHNKFVMCKIFGSILGFNSKFKLNIKNYQDVDFKKDLLFYDFTIETNSGIYYNGSIMIKR